MPAQMYEYDKNSIKNNLDIDDVKALLNDLGAEPIPGFGEVLYCKTICHHAYTELSEAGHKLYYYDNTKLFKCYTSCADVFDIFELVRKVKTQETNIEWSLPKAVQYVADFFGISGNEIALDVDRIEDWDVLERYDSIKTINKEKKIIEYKTYDGRFLKHLPRPAISSWLQEGITQTAMDTFEICYEPKNQCIVIPHRDMEGNLIGVRQRTLIKEVANKYGKYRPLRIGKTLYNHALSFNLYGLYQNKENIIRAKKALVVEGEKSVMIYESIFGRDNNICVACCGSSFIEYQAWLLINLGVEEIIIGFDHDFTDVNSESAKKMIRNLKNIHKKYGKYTKVSMIWDKDNLTGLKSSPLDYGQDVFISLYKNRINLY